jgi:type IV secretory pathway VirJ component
MTSHFCFRIFRRLAAATALCSCMTVHAAATHVAGGSYGEVTVAWPTGSLRGFVVLFSSGKSWSAVDQQAARALAQTGLLTVGVDTERYASNLAATKKTCHQVVGDAEALGHQLEREVGSSRYFAPIVAGSGQGATLAMHILAQAPANTIDGAVALDPQPRLDPRFQLCPPDPIVSRGRGLPGFLETGATSPAGDTAATQVEREIRAEDEAAAIGMHGMRGALAPEAVGTPRHFSADVSRGGQLLALIDPHLQATVAAREDVTDLPLVELPAAHPTGLLAVVISGDGGWRDLDKTIAESLQKDGVSVIGWDSLRYFWSEKTPEQTSRDLARVLQTYGVRWHASHIALIGYSFGADVMPFAYNRLPASLRAKVSLVSLLGFAPAADFQVRVTGWLGMPASDQALQVRPELARLPARIVECFYGEHEEDTLCPALAGTGIEIIRTSGEHHFGGHYDELEKHILSAWKKQIDAHG